MSNVEERTDKEGSVGKTENENIGKTSSNYKQWGEMGLSVVFDSLIVIFSVVFLYWSFGAGGFVLFAWHPALFSLAFICFMTQAILLFSGASLLSRFVKPYKSRVQIHWILQTCANVCALLGFLCIVYNKIVHEKSHFESIHSIFGLSTVICCVLSIAGGVFTKFSMKYRKKIAPVKLKIGHALFGVTTYILGGLTIVLGIFSQWYTNHYSPYRYFAVAAIVLIWIYSIFNPLKIAYQRMYRLYVSI